MYINLKSNDNFHLLLSSHSPTHQVSYSPIYSLTNTPPGVSVKSPESESRVESQHALASRPRMVKWRLRPQVYLHKKRVVAPKMNC